VDESTFAEPNPCVGAGMLISDEEIKDEIINIAIENLKKDPDIHKPPENKLDKRTISRGWFHASEDSKNAHSHLLTEINKNINAEFVSEFHDIAKKSKNLINRDYYAVSLINSTLSAMHTRDNAKFFIEHRPGLTMSILENNHKELEKELLSSIYNLPMLPVYFPKIEYSIVKKNNPGVQCTDLLLWAVNRRVNGDSKWHDRIKSRFKSVMMTQSKDWGNDDFLIGKGVKGPVRYYTDSSFPIDSDKIVSREMLLKFYLKAIKIVEYYSNNPLQHLSHLQNEINNIAKEKLNLVCKNYLERLFSIYLKIFDMIPLINNTTSQSDVQYLLLSRKYLSLPLKHDELHAITTRMFYSKIRKEIIKNNPSLLN